ncbi:MAG TPA: response regulator [Candidatus Hydrogenedentes bacterium]|nr:response regulator [Candidatus Hydrogenedentota bacterium]
MSSADGNSRPPDIQQSINHLYMVVFILLGVGACLECGAVMLSYTWGHGNTLDEWMSFGGACFIFAAGALVIYAIGVAPALVFSAAFFFLLSRGLNITRATPWFDTVPLIGIQSFWSKIIENVVFTIGSLLLIASFAVAAIAAHRSRRELAERHQALLQEVEERKHAEEEWRKSEQNALAILNATTDIAFLMEPDGTLIAANQHFAKTFGKSVSELLGTNILDLLPPELVKSRKERIAECLQTGEPIRFKDQRFGRWLNNSIYPLFDNQGKVVRLAVFGRDITHERLMEQQLLQSQKMQALGRLAGGVAHDFRNVLMLILGHCELALRELPENHPVRENLRLINKAGQRASSLVKQILTFSHKEELERHPVPVYFAVREALRFLRATLPSSIEIRQELTDDSGMILSDATQIHQVVVNLCTNAAQAMGEKGGMLEIRLDTCEIKEETHADAGVLRKGLYARLSVRDTGCGIPGAILPSIFDPFFTTKEFGEGTGLGLSIVHGIVLGGGGAITVQSELNRGTVFQVYWPKLEGVLLLPQTEEAVERPGKMRALVLDDELDIVSLAAQLLRSQGYEVECLTDSVSALELVRIAPHRFDVVIADNVMPKLSGIDLAREIALVAPNLPVILMTGYGASLTPEQVRAMGIAGYIIKPFSIQTLNAAIQDALEGKKSQDS